jgi:two-component system NtrC family sensor kinase
MNPGITNTNELAPVKEQVKPKHIFISLKTRLIFNFSMVILLSAALSLIIGVRMIGNTIIRQAQDKVRLDLNSAREIYQREIANIKSTVRLTAERFFLKEEIIKGNRERLIKELQYIRQQESLDILNLTDHTGQVIVRSRNPGITGDRLRREVVEAVLAQKKAAASTQIVPQEDLEKEGKDIIQQAGIKPVNTPRGYSRADTGKIPGMVITAAAPVLDYNGALLGVLCGEKLLNRRYEIVDKVKDIVYRGQKYKGKDLGTVTIFQEGVRISTNVTGQDGKRAIGTRVSQDVYRQVIGKGIPWIDRAFVVRDWYITAYEPITNLAGDIIGMLYVGILEAPYRDLRNRVIFDFLAVALLSLILLICIAYFTASRTVKPLKQLMIATRKAARGDLSHRVRIESHDEIGRLADSFNQMAIDLEKVTQQYQALNRTLEQRVRQKTRELEEAQNQLLQTEKLSSLGKMAAGVAHEINNPLTSILINAHLLAKQLEKDQRSRETLKIIIDETTRCGTIVKDLLHFSRQTQAMKTLADVNQVIEKSVAFLKNQIALQKVVLNIQLEPTLPWMVIDMDKIEQVFTNVILNALDAMPNGGELSISSRVVANNNSRELEIKFGDNGCGIPREAMGRIFDPFFTTKGTKGTGLGLSVSYGILQQHNGDIDIQSEEGKGTTVTIHLPVNDSSIKEDKHDI